MVYSNSVRWLRPYVEAVSDLVPIEKITHIKGYRVRPGFTEETQGVTKKWQKKFSINIRMWDLTEDKRNHRYRRYYHILEVLAHELAHVQFWEHTEEHFRLTANVLLKFSDLLNAHGILDTSERIKKKMVDKYLEEEPSAGVN